MFLWACVVCAFVPLWYVPMSLCAECKRACVVCAYGPVWYVPRETWEGGPCWLANGDLWSTNEGVLPWLVRWALRASTRDFYPALAALVSPVQTMRIWACVAWAHELLLYVHMSLCGMCLWAFVICAYEPVCYVPMSLCDMRLKACVVCAYEPVWYEHMSLCGMCLGASVVEVSILRPGVASLSLCEAVRSSPQSYDVYNCWITTADMKKHLAEGGGGANMEKGRNGESNESSWKMDNLGQMFFWCTIFYTFGRTTAGFILQTSVRRVIIFVHQYCLTNEPSIMWSAKKSKKDICHVPDFEYCANALLVYIRSFTEMDDKIQHGIL